MTALRDHVQTLLADWRRDVSAPWRTFFGEVEPEYTAIGAQFVYAADHPVIPPRKGLPVAGAPAGAHIFRAFDGVDPADARVVVIGQDPYPDRRKATGRAFEDGSIVSWTGAVAASLKSLLLSASALRLGEPALGQDPAEWTTLRTRLLEGSYALEPIGDYFDRLQKDNGVMFVNAGWTLTRFVRGGSAEQRAHIALWRPVMARLLEGLAARPGRPLVFLLLGNFAQNLFDASGVEAAAKADGRWGTLVGRVDHPHPNAPSYFGRPNPLEQVNQALAAMGASPVEW
jgi:uracil DNA glycosylase